MPFSCTGVTKNLTLRRTREMISRDSSFSILSF
jgi:hypothetical protein